MSVCHPLSTRKYVCEQRHCSSWVDEGYFKGNIECKSGIVTLDSDNPRMGITAFCQHRQITLKRLNGVLASTLRMVLGCMRSTFIPVLLAETGELPQSLRKSALADNFLICNLSWRDNPLIPKLQFLQERTTFRRSKAGLDEISLLSSYVMMRDITKFTFRSRRTVYFD